MRRGRVTRILLKRGLLDRAILDVPDFSLVIIGFNQIGSRKSGRYVAGTIPHKYSG